MVRSHCQTQTQTLIQIAMGSIVICACVGVCAVWTVLQITIEPIVVCISSGRVNAPLFVDIFCFCSCFCLVWIGPYGLFTLHGNGTRTSTGNGTGTLGNGSWSQTSVNISTWHCTFYLFPVSAPVPLPYIVNKPLEAIRNFSQGHVVDPITVCCYFRICFYFCGNYV